MFNVKIKVKEANNSLSWPRRRRSSPNLGYNDLNRNNNVNGLHQNGVTSTPNGSIRSTNRAQTTSSLLRGGSTSSKRKSLRHDKRVRIVTNQQQYSSTHPSEDEMPSFPWVNSKTSGKHRLWKGKRVFLRWMRNEKGRNWSMNWRSG